jgi:hypothetical protein
MEYEGTLHIVRTADSKYSVTFTPRDQNQGASGAQLTFDTENDFAQFLLDAGFGAQHADGIQGAVHSVGHHTVDDFRISDKEWRRLFAPSAAAAL